MTTKVKADTAIYRETDTDDLEILVHATVYFYDRAYNEVDIDTVTLNGAPVELTDEEEEKAKEKLLENAIDDLRDRYDSYQEYEKD